MLYASLTFIMRLESTFDTALMMDWLTRDEVFSILPCGICVDNLNYYANPLS